MQPTELLPQMSLRWETEKFQYLGMTVAHTNSGRQQYNIDRVIGGLMESVKFWNTLPLLLMGWAVISKMVFL